MIYAQLFLFFLAKSCRDLLSLIFLFSVFLPLRLVSVSVSDYVSSLFDVCLSVYLLQLYVNIISSIMISMRFGT